MINPQHLKIRVMTEKQLPINPVVEEEIKQLLKTIWDKRIFLSSGYIELLKKISKLPNK